MANMNAIYEGLRQKSNFKSGNNRGFKVDGASGYDYVCMSYDTVIARFLGADLVYFNDKKYSTTTSRLQNAIRALTTE